MDVYTAKRVFVNNRFVQICVDSWFFIKLFVVVSGGSRSAAWRQKNFCVFRGLLMIYLHISEKNTTFAAAKVQQSY